MQSVSQNNQSNGQPRQHINSPVFTSNVVEKQLFDRTIGRYDFEGGAYVSIRSRQRGAKCSRILRSAIGANGSAGGHMHIAAGFLRLGEGTWAEREGRRLAFVRALVRKIVKGAPEDSDSFERFAHGLLEPLSEEKPTKQLKLGLT